MNGYDPFREEERRESKNRLKRVAVASEQQDVSQIDRWLDLAKKMFDTDDDPAPNAA